jgi:hypothetical protein
MLYIYGCPDKSQGGSDDSESPSRASKKLRVDVFTENMDLAGDIVQDMCVYFGVQELESEVVFPT